MLTWLFSLLANTLVASLLLFAPLGYVYAVALRETAHGVNVLPAWTPGQRFSLRLAEFLYGGLLVGASFAVGLVAAGLAPGPAEDRSVWVGFAATLTLAFGVAVARARPPDRQRVAKAHVVATVLVATLFIVGYILLDLWLDSLF